MDQDYYFVGSVSGSTALVFRRTDGGTAATPFLSVLHPTNHTIYNFSSNSFVAWTSIESADWGDYASAMFTGLDGGAAATPNYDTQDPMTSLAAGVYIIQIHASDTYNAAIVARCPLYYDGAGNWSEPESYLRSQIAALEVASTNIDQSDVPPSRTSIITQTQSSGLYGTPVEISVGDTGVLYAFDFRKDLEGEKVSSVTSVTIYQSNGTAATQVTDSGTYWKDGPQAKAKLTGVTAATGLYAEVIVVYTGSTGTRKATVPITCVA